MGQCQGPQDIASQQGIEARIKEIVTGNGPHINHQGVFGMTALMETCFYGTV
jgi:hypothetical protein